MTAAAPPDPADEIQTLVQVLVDTERRLQQLTGGEVDSVVDGDGRQVVLRHAQEQLRQNDALKQSAILDALPAHIALLDAHGVIVSVNAAWQRFAAANAAEGTPHEPRLDYHLAVCDQAQGAGSELAREAAAGVRAVLEGTEPGFCLEYDCHSPAAQRWFQLTVTPLAGTPPLGVVVMHLDISARKAAELRLAESEEEYRLLFDSNPHAMWVFDLETLAFLAVNDAAVHVYGYSRDEFLAMTIKDIRPPEEVPALLEYLKTMEATPSQRAIHVKHRKKDGTRLEVDGVTSPIQFRGRDARLVLASDVSDKRRLEGQLLHAQKMDAVGRLAGGIAHDFNNSLGVILGYTELLNRHAAENQRGKLAQILKATERAAVLTRQLLTFSRKQVVDPKVLDLNALLFNLETMLHRLLGEDVELTIAYGGDLGRVSADAGQLEQVVMNLCVNARDAMPLGGSLRIHTSRQQVAAGAAGLQPMPAGCYATVAVSDNGAGMTRETVSQIFEPFFTTKAPGKGTGLGLAMVYGIVKQAGGFVFVDSEVGHGTTFNIYLPQVDAELEAAATGAMPIPAAGSETILLVEDEDALREITAEILRAQGYCVIDARGYLEALLTANGFTVESAGDGAAALAAARQAPPDVVVCDLLMPVMDGYTLLRHWKADARLRLVPFIVYTATYVGAEDEALALGLGADAFILKPVEPEDFLSRVRAVQANAAAAVPLRPGMPPGDESSQLKLYNEALIRKLEQRTLALEEAKRALQLDVAQRQLAERQAQTALQRLHEAQRLGHIGDWDCDLVSQVITWSPEVFEILGRDPALGPPRTFEENDALFERASAGPLAVRMAQVVSSGEPEEYELVAVRPDGTRIHLHAVAVAQRDDTGAVARVHGTIQDISARKRADAALREREAEFRLLAESMPQVVWIAGPDGANVYMSTQWTEYSGRTAEESLGFRWSESVHPEDRDAAFAVWQHAIATGDAYMVEGRLRRSDGAYRWWLVRGVPVRDDAGAILKWFGTCTDVHDLKQAQLAIAESERRFARVFNAENVGFGIAEIGSGRLVDVNENCAAFFGHSRETMIGRRIDLDAWVDPGDYQRLMAGIAAAGTRSAEVSILHPSGEVRHALISAEAMTLDDGREPLFLFVLVDASERKRLEGQLLQSQKMEAVGRLAGGIAHDFNNSLGVILGYTESLMKQASEEQRSRLEQILKATRRASTLTRQLLAFGRKQVMDPRVVDLNVLLADAADMLRRVMGEDIALTLVPGAELGQVRVDPGQLEQVVMNICMNARDAMPDGGVLRLETSNAEMDEAHAARHGDMAPGRYVRLAISDTGAGIDGAMLPHIFEPFFASKLDGKGTGLGLAMVYGTVKQAGGSVLVSSKVGQGTTFDVYLPRIDAPVVADAAATDVARPEAKQTILLVEDEPALREIARELLEEFGYTVLEAATPRDAIEIAGGHVQPIDLLLTDVVMPGMNGQVLADTLLLTRPALRVIYMSGYADDVLAHRRVLQSGTQLLEKPFTAVALMGRVRAALSREQASLPA